MTKAVKNEKDGTLIRVEFYLNFFLERMNEGTIFFLSKNN
jgi:hypothetical protein